jgi:ADP-ribosylglycohydrolase
VAVGIGQNTLRVLGDFRRNGYLEALPFGSRNDGNGALMRLAPIPCFLHADVDSACAMASAQSRATHASRSSEECCEVLAELLCQLINGQPLRASLGAIKKRQWGRGVTAVLNREIDDEVEANIASGGYVVDTLKAALWSTLSTNGFEEAVLKAANLGDDADTTSAVTGQLAGALYGYSSIPNALKVGLIDERKLYVTSQLLHSLNGLQP